MKAASCARSEPLTRSRLRLVRASRGDALWLRTITIPGVGVHPAFCCGSRADHFVSPELLCRNSGRTLHTSYSPQRGAALRSSHRRARPRGEGEREREPDGGAVQPPARALDCNKFALLGGGEGGVRKAIAFKFPSRVDHWLWVVKAEQAHVLAANRSALNTRIII